VRNAVVTPGQLVKARRKTGSSKSGTERKRGSNECRRTRRGEGGAWGATVGSVGEGEREPTGSAMKTRGKGAENTTKVLPKKAGLVREKEDNIGKVTRRGGEKRSEGGKKEDKRQGEGGPVTSTKKRLTNT